MHLEICQKTQSMTAFQWLKSFPKENLISRVLENEVDCFCVFRKPEIFKISEMRELFKNPEVKKGSELTDSIKWIPFSPENSEIQLKKFLIDEKNFSKERIAKVIDRLVKMGKQKTKPKLRIRETFLNENLLLFFAFLNLIFEKNLVFLVPHWNWTKDTTTKSFDDIFWTISNSSKTKKIPPKTNTDSFIQSPNSENEKKEKPI